MEEYWDAGSQSKKGDSWWVIKQPISKMFQSFSQIFHSKHLSTANSAPTTKTFSFAFISCWHWTVLLDLGRGRVQITLAKMMGEIDVNGDGVIATRRHGMAIRSLRSMSALRIVTPRTSKNLSTGFLVKI